MKKPTKTLTPREAAATLGFSLNYVYKLLYAGQLSAEKKDGAWQIPAEAVEEKLAAR